MIRDLRISKPSQWYSKLKRLCSYDQHQSDPIEVETIKHMTNKEQVEVIADKFARVSQEYDPFKTENIEIPPFDKSQIPKF